MNAPSRCQFACLIAIGTMIGAINSVANAEPVQSHAGDGFVSMFNGRDLAGWEGAPDWWQVRNGLLVAESTPSKPCVQSHYLYWIGGAPANFEMRATYRITGDANSGIQFRSKKRPAWDTWGYQADADSAGIYTGCLYQHDRGLVAERGQQVHINSAGEKTISTFGDPAKLLEAVHPQDWNEYRIRADGPTIMLWINGERMCQVEDHQPQFALPRGIIALQMHLGPPMKVEFKDLRIRMLD